MRASTLLLAVLVVAQPFTMAAVADTPDDRAAAYQEFRTAFDKADYKAALLPAERVVEMTKSQFGADAPEMANALTNLATTYYRMHQHGDALDNYRSAVSVLELQNDAADTRLVRPLHGLGSTLLAMRREDEAIVPLKRAVDIIRNRDGLHAEAQLPVLKTLIAGYVAAGRAADAGREQEYALNVAEAAYGKNDPRMLGPIGDLAQWYEHTGRYTAARLLYARAVQVADAAKPNGIEAVPSLRGIARSFRLAYVYGESDDSVANAMQAFTDPQTGSNISQAVNAPSSDGEVALRSALQRLGTAPAQAAQRGAVLVDLGDWFLTANKLGVALGNWRSAWNELAAAGDTSTLNQPAMVIYRPPPIAVSQRQKDPNEYAAQPVDIRLTLDANGKVGDTTVANPAPAREAAEKAVIGAVRHAVWRPAFRDGQPVAADDYTFHELVYVKLPKSAG